MKFSRDGRWFVTADDDGTARVWKSDTGTEWLTLAGHQGPVWWADFSPDGTQVHTAAADGTVRRWAIDPLPLARDRKPRELTADERSRYELHTGP